MSARPRFSSSNPPVVQAPRPLLASKSVATAFWRLWGWPLALGLLTTSGLLSALVSDGWGDAWSWLALGLPVAVMAWHAWQRPGRAGRARRAASSSP